MKHNVDPDRLSAVGYGEYQPIASNETEEGKLKNRRVVIAVRATM
jgi:chemotaxis protein MotB